MTYVQNPSYPSTESSSTAMSCAYTISALASAPGKGVIFWDQNVSISSSSNKFWQNHIIAIVYERYFTNIEISKPTKKDDFIQSSKYNQRIAILLDLKTKLNKCPVQSRGSTVRKKSRY